MHGATAIADREASSANASVTGILDECLTGLRRNSVGHDVASCVNELCISRGRAAVIHRYIVKVIFYTKLLKVDRDAGSSCAANRPVTSAAEYASVVEVDHTSRLSEREATPARVAAPSSSTHGRDLQREIAALATEPINVNCKSTRARGCPDDVRSQTTAIVVVAFNLSARAINDAHHGVTQGEKLYSELIGLTSLCLQAIRSRNRSPAVGPHRSRNGAGIHADGGAASATSRGTGVRGVKASPGNASVGSELHIGWPLGCDGGLTGSIEVARDMHELRVIGVCAVVHRDPVVIALCVEGGQCNCRLLTDGARHQPSARHAVRVRRVGERNDALSARKR